MTRNPRRLLLVLGLVTCALLAAGAVAILCLGRTTRLPPLPSPNGYDDLLKAGRLSTRFDSVNDLDHDRLRILVATNSKALRPLRVGLARHCAVPTESTIANFSTISGDLIGLRSLARVLVAEGRLAEIENRPTDAAHSYLDAIRLGAEMSHGGLMINRLVGIACEGMGCIPLVRLLPRLNCEEMRPLIAQLEAIDTNSVTWAEVTRNENRFVRAQAGTYPNPVKLIADLWQSRAMRRASEERHDLAAAHIRLLTAEMAMRCYVCDQGNAPGSLEQLVPKYMQLVPLDPFGTGALIYHPNGTNWLLYSVGPDRRDDGGKPAGKTISGDYLIGFGISESGKGQIKGDVLYDSPW